MACTPRMRDFAKAIAEELGLEEPDYDNFREVSDFIDEHKQEYYDSIHDFD